MLTLKRLFFPVLVAIIVFFTTFLNSAFAQENYSQGAKIFQVYCAGCHPNGSNIIRRGKNLKISALKRNGVDSMEGIANMVRYGKNNMSSFQDKLSETQIKEVAHYVLQQANNNWKY
jgi:cytochrome c6